MHNWFENQVQIRPLSPAVEAHDGCLSYEELDVLSTQLAHHFSCPGRPTRDASSILFFSKSVWATVAVLGILKSGGGCAALDPAHPSSRLEHIVADLNAFIVVISEGHAGLFDTMQQCMVVISLDTPLFDQLPILDYGPCPFVSPNNTAFTIFTSGSTGTPKESF